MDREVVSMRCSPTLECQINDLQFIFLLRVLSVCSVFNKWEPALKTEEISS